MRYVLILTGLILLTWTAATSLTRVQSNERAVVRRFGRILDDKPLPGLHIGLPWGIDRVELVSVQERDITVGFMEKSEPADDAIPPGQLLTGDHNLVNVQTKINYRVRETEIDKYVLQKDRVDAFVARAAESLMAEWIAGQNVNDVLAVGMNALAAHLLDALPGRLQAYNLGIEIKSVSVPIIRAPDEVKSAFDLVNQAATTIKTKVNGATQAADTRRAVAAGKVFRIKSEASAYSQEEYTKALAEANSFLKRLEQYRAAAKENSDYLNVLWLDEMTRLYGKMRANGQIELLDHFVTNGEITITEFPLQKKK